MDVDIKNSNLKGNIKGDHICTGCHYIVYLYNQKKELTDRWIRLRGYDLTPITLTQNIHETKPQNTPEKEN